MAQLRHLATLVVLAATVALAGCGGGSPSDTLTVEATIDGTDLAGATSRSPLPLDPTEESTLTLALSNPSNADLVVERVRLEGEMLGLNFLTYDVRVRAAVAAGSTTTLDVPLEFFDLERQASGYLRAHVRTYDSDKERLSSNEFAVDIAGSPWSTMNLFAYALFFITVAGTVKNVRDMRKGRLPANRFHRGIRFAVPGLGLGLLLSVAFSVLRIMPLPTAGWLSLTVLPVLGAFALGYLIVPGGNGDDGWDDDGFEDDADDDELLDAIVGGS